jgi:uncharacterized protein with PIN domain
MVTIVHFCEEHGIVNKEIPNHNYCPECGRMLRSGSETVVKTLYPEGERQHEQAVDTSTPQRA